MKYKQQTRDGMKPEQTTWCNTRKAHDDDHLDYEKISSYNWDKNDTYMFITSGAV
jgi:hypothetical protein